MSENQTRKRYGGCKNSRKSEKDVENLKIQVLFPFTTFIYMYVEKCHKIFKSNKTFFFDSSLPQGGQGLLPYPLPYWSTGAQLEKRRT